MGKAFLLEATYSGVRVRPYDERMNSSRSKDAIIRQLHMKERSPEFYDKVRYSQAFQPG
jgi:hypothetical protein